MKNWINRGNIISTSYDLTLPGRYIGNGRFGTVLSPFGLNQNPQRQKEKEREGRSHFSHMAHWGRFSFCSEQMKHMTCADYLLPMFSLYWKKDPCIQAGSYLQVQDFESGIVETSFSEESGRKVQIRAWMDMEEKDLSCFDFQTEGPSAEIALDVVSDFIPYPFLYKTKTIQTILCEQVPFENEHTGAFAKAAPTMNEELWKIRMDCPSTVNDSRVEIILRTNMEVKKTKQGLVLLVSEGRHALYIQVQSSGGGRDSSQGMSLDDLLNVSLTRSKKRWKKLWEQSGWFSFPQDEVQKVYVRSLAYLLSSFEDQGSSIQPISGLTGNMFPFNFVQDMAYVAPSLLMTGHGSIVMGWVEHFAHHIPEIKAYAKLLWSEAEGICPPWELNFGPMEEYHRPGVPVIYCYEPHNIGYLCRIASEAGEYEGTDSWNRDHVLPIVQGCAEFYASLFHKEKDGKWHFECTPCVGQDEAGGRNRKDYLCSLYSARYTFMKAVEWKVEGFEKYQHILEEGLPFETLQSEREILHTALHTDDFGKQKHPVQLDGITYMPTGICEKWEKEAYLQRYELTQDAKKPFFYGWTLGQFLLAGANVGEVEGYQNDWKALRASNYTDPDYVQIYETSGEAEKSFYMATHGMILQSLIRCYVNDYWGDVRIEGCPAFGKEVRYGQIRTRNQHKIAYKEACWRRLW